MSDITNTNLRGLEAYAELFGDAFRRRDQAKWMRVYLQGLLAPGERKTVETMARQVTPPDGRVEDLAQALQNFVNQSPWDEQALWQRYRSRVASRRLNSAGVFVIDDVGFPKQGQQSVGVQRQFWSAAGKKANCQIAVALSWCDADGCVPLALRLYLPRTWLNAPDRLDAAGVPAEARRAMLRTDIALELLDEVRAEGFAAAAVVAGPGYASAEFRRALAERDSHYLVSAAGDFLVVPEAPVAVGAPVSGQAFGGWRSNGHRSAPLADLAPRSGHGRRFDWITVADDGLGDPGIYGSGETRRVLVEHRPDGRTGFAFTNLPLDASVAEAGDRWRARGQAESAYRRMRDELGLDHFEGRSWRGFHHHTCLVALAYGFLLTNGGT
jgi:SRSO17 transposase